MSRERVSCCGTVWRVSGVFYRVCVFDVWAAVVAESRLTHWRTRCHCAAHSNVHPTQIQMWNCLHQTVVHLMPAMPVPFPVTVTVPVLCLSLSVNSHVCSASAAVASARHCDACSRGDVKAVGMFVQRGAALVVGRLKWSEAPILKFERCRMDQKLPPGGTPVVVPPTVLGCPKNRHHPLQCE